jgi:hypothetical protein
MAAELTPRQLRVQASAEKRSLATAVDQDGAITYLTVSNPRRPYAGKLAMGARTNPSSGRLNHFAMVDGKLTPLNMMGIHMSGMEDYEH